MQKEILVNLYAQPEVLNYLRYNPEWYKILYHQPERYKEFEEEAKSHLKIRTYDKIENFKNHLSFLSSIITYATK